MKVAADCDNLGKYLPGLFLKELCDLAHCDPLSRKNSNPPYSKVAADMLSSVPGGIEFNTSSG